MKNALKILILSLAAFLLPRVLYFSSTTLIAEACDPKLGCLGSWQVELLIAAIFGLIASLAVLPTLLYLKPTRKPAPKPAMFRFWIISNLLLSATYPYFLNSHLLDSSQKTAIAWFVFALLVHAMAALLINKPDTNHRPTP